MHDSSPVCEFEIMGLTESNVRGPVLMRRLQATRTSSYRQSSKSREMTLSGHAGEVLQPTIIDLPKKST